MSQDNKFNVVKAKQISHQNEVEFRDGMFFTVNFLPRTSLQKIFNDSKIRKMDYKTARKEEELDGDKFSRKFCSEVVAGWRGVTPRKIAKLVPIDLVDFTEAERDEEVEFSQEQMSYLLKNAYDLDSFLQGYCQNLDNFVPERGYEQKNSESSQSGS